MMHPKGDNNWLYENMGCGPSPSVAKSNFRQPLRYNDYIMQNQNQASLKNEQYSNYYNHFMSTQNNASYSNNYSNYSNYTNYSYVNNQQGVQNSQSAWGPHQNPYCHEPSCRNHLNPLNAAPTKTIQYPHNSYERPSVSHNMGRLENPVMDSLGHMSNYTPQYNQPSNYENPHMNNPKMIQNNKKLMPETSKIQVRNVFELNNTVCNQTDPNIAQRGNKPGQMNYFLNYIPDQNQSQIIPSVKQHENICSVHGNFNHMKPHQHEGMKSFTNLPVTNMCQNVPNINPVKMNQNNGYSYQNNASRSLNLTQQLNHNFNIVEKITRERNNFLEKIDAESAYRKKLSCMQEAVNSEKARKALTYAIEPAKTQESTVTGTGIPKKSPSGRKGVKDLTEGSRSLILKKALLAKETLTEELQNGSNSQRMDEVEEDTPEVITIKEEKEDWLSENSYTVETCVIENESINKNQDEDLYVIKSKFENKINKDKLTSLMGFLSQESFSNKRNTIVQNASPEKDISPTLERVQPENNNNNKRKLDEDTSNRDRRKLAKKSSSGMISLALAKSIDAEDIESLKSIVLKECGLEPELDFRAQSRTIEESDASLNDTDEEVGSKNIERYNNIDDNSKVVEKLSNSSPKKGTAKEVIERNTKKRRPSKRRSKDDVTEKKHVDVRSGRKTKDVGVQMILDPEMCSSCLSKSPTESEEMGGIIKTMKAFQSLKNHKCLSCNLTCPSITFWINVVTCELRCLNCFKKMVKKTDEPLK